MTLKRLIDAQETTSEK